MVPRVRKVQGSLHVEHLVTPERNSESSVGTVTRLRTGLPMDGVRFVAEVVCFCAKRPDSRNRPGVEADH